MSNFIRQWRQDVANLGTPQIDMAEELRKMQALRDMQQQARENAKRLEIEEGVDARKRELHPSERTLKQEEAKAAQYGNVRAPVRDKLEDDAVTAQTGAVRTRTSVMEQEQKLQDDASRAGELSSELDDLKGEARSRRSQQLAVESLLAEGAGDGFDPRLVSQRASALMADSDKRVRALGSNQARVDPNDNIETQYKIGKAMQQSGSSRVANANKSLDAFIKSQGNSIANVRNKIQASRDELANVSAAIETLGPNQSQYGVLDQQDFTKRVQLLEGFTGQKAKIEVVDGKRVLTNFDELAVAARGVANRRSVAGLPPDVARILLQQADEIGAGRAEQERGSNIMKGTYLANQFVGGSRGLGPQWGENLWEQSPESTPAPAPEPPPAPPRAPPRQKQPVRVSVPAQYVSVDPRTPGMPVADVRGKLRLSGLESKIKELGPQAPAKLMAAGWQRGPNGTMTKDGMVYNPADGTVTK